MTNDRYDRRWRARNWLSVFEIVFETPWRTTTETLSRDVPQHSEG